MISIENSENTTGIIFCPERQLLILSDNNGKICVYKYEDHPQNNQLITSFDAHIGPIQNMSISPL